MPRLVLSFVFTVSCLLPSLALAQRGGNPNAVEQIPNPFCGTIVGTSGNSITVKGDIGKPKGNANDPNYSKDTSRRITFTIRKDTKITKDGTAITATDLKKDDEVAISFTSKEGSSQRKVTDIAIGKMPEGAAKPEAPAEEKDKKGKKDKKDKKDKEKNS